MSRRTTAFVAGGLAVALLVGGAASFFASGSPDGLEKVASQQGFDDTEDSHDLADSPLADYETRGIDQGYLGGGLAGVAGVGLCFLVAGGLVYVVRRRGAGDSSGGQAQPPGERSQQ